MSTNNIFEPGFIVDPSEIENFTPVGIDCQNCASLRGQLIASTEIAAGALKGEQRYMYGFNQLQRAYMDALQLSNDRRLRVLELAKEVKQLQNEIAILKSQKR